MVGLFQPGKDHLLIAAINWKIFHKKKFRLKKIVVMGRLGKILTCWKTGDIVWNLTAFERSSMEDFRRCCCIRGYNVQEIWEAAAGEVPESVREPHNIQNQYVMAAKRNGKNPQTFTTKVVKSAFALFAMILGLGRPSLA